MDYIRQSMNTVHLESVPRGECFLFLDRLYMVGFCPDWDEDWVFPVGVDLRDGSIIHLSPDEDVVPVTTSPITYELIV